MARQNTNSVPLNQALLNVITPIGLELRKNSFVIGENTGRVYGVIKYPQKVDIGWLSKVTNIPGTIVSVSFRPVDNGALIGAISKSITQNRGMAESAKDALSRQRAEKAAEDGERIMLQIDQHGEIVGLMSIAIMPLAAEEKALTRVCRRVESTMSVLKCKIRVLANLQEDGLKHISPTYPLNERVASIIERIVPLSTVIGGFPFASSGFNDGTGYYVGRDTTGGLVILDTWRRGDDRTNSNMVFMGVAGVGKSTAIKHIALAEYMKGTKLIFIDPETEYKDLCLSLNGDWINAAGSSAGRINPLQIRPAPQDEEGEEHPLYKDEGHGMSHMALHLKNLEIFFNLYLPSLSDMQRAILKKSVIELYNRFNIFWETDITVLKNTDFPIFSNLLTLIEEKAAENPGNSMYSDLALLLFDIAKGGDSFLWNGYSTIETHTRCICLDTHALQNTGDNIKRTEVVKAALTKVGAPYVWGAKGDTKFDCSGLVYWSIAQVNSSLGSKMYTSAAGQAKWCSDNGYTVGRSELQPGDLVFWQNLGCPGCSRWNEVHHTGIYIGNGKVVEASSSNGRVIVRELWSSAIYPLYMFARPYNS